MRIKSIIITSSITIMLALTFFGLSASPASAHAMPSSVVSLDFHQKGVEAELVLPLDRLEIAFRKTLTNSPKDVLNLYKAELSSYIKDHVHPLTSEEQNWSVSVTNMSLQLDSEPYDLIVHLSMQPPAGASSLAFTFNYDVIVHQLITHSVLVTVRNDWNNGVFSNDPQLLGTIRGDQTSIAVNQSAGNWWHGFRDVILLGMQHIAEGIDHLLFLIVLLLPAPLLVTGKQWTGFAGTKPSIRRLLKVVTAFTIGHSITLIIGAVGWLHLPSQLIEVLIAFSILISAIHAFRPLFPGREAFVAGGFGLIHGMAFASLIADMGFTPWRMAFSILGFNLGIELMQLVVIAITVPWLILLCLTPAYKSVRIIGASIGVIAAIGWIVERIMNHSNVVSNFIDIAAEHALWFIIGLAVTAILATLRRLVKRHRVQSA